MAEAVADYVRRLVEEDTERAFKLGAKIDQQTERLAGVGRESQMRADMVLEALRHQFPALEEISNDELRRRALNTRRRER